MAVASLRIALTDIANDKAPPYASTRRPTAMTTSAEA